MEETLQQDSDNKVPNEDQGGIRRRLRDRDLLKKRKAEAEEKETNPWVLGVESQRKRSRPANKSSSKRRGRPRKNEAAVQIAVQEGPVVAVEPESAEAVPDQMPDTAQNDFTATKEESTPAFGSGQRLIFGPFQSPVAAPTLSSPVNQAPDAVSIPALPQEPVRAQVEAVFTEASNQILIEDLGPDEDEDIAPSQDAAADEDLSETLSINEPGQTKMYSVPILSSPAVPQEYFPGNQL